MPASYTLKRLGADDVPLLRALNEMFGEAFKEPDTYTGAPPSDDYFKELLGNGDFVALVALKDDQGEKNVIAGLAGYMLRKFERARAELFVYDLAVREGFRRQGIATAMLEETRNIAAACGAYVVIIFADDGDEAPIAVYSRLGKMEKAVSFDIPVKANT